MNSEQKLHLSEIQLKFIKEHQAKFYKGAEEHKTQLHKDFSADQLLEFAIEEVIDLVSYLYTLRQNIKESLDYCEEQNGMRVCKNCGLGE
jgi:hypothetical protein